MKNSKTVVFKRQQELLALLKEHKNIAVEDAASLLAVSPTTVRRDLKMFEEQHLIARFHGGAQLLTGTLKEEDEHPSTDKALVDGDEKRTIARYAAGLIEDGDTVFLNSSSTVALILSYVKDRRVIFVTNNGTIANYPVAPQVEVLMTGGELYQRKKSLVGEFALHTLSKITANKAFIGVGGISADAGLTTSVLPETAINAMMLRRAKKTYVLTAARKIGKGHNFLSAPLSAAQMLITCEGADQQAVAAIRAEGCDVVELPINFA